jgi:hypothetical protein
MLAPRAMREAIVPLNIDTSRFDRSVSRIQTGPIPAEVAQMPSLVDEAVCFLLAHVIVDELMDNAIV